MSTLAKPRSASNSSTFWPVRDRAWQSVTANQVLPTPPLPDAPAMLFRPFASLVGGPAGVGSSDATILGPFIDVIPRPARGLRSEEHTSALQSLMPISYAVSCLKR